MLQKKFAEPPVYHYRSNKPSIASQFEWSVNTFKVCNLIKHHYPSSMPLLSSPKMKPSHLKILLLYIYVNMTTRSFTFLFRQRNDVKF
jgi:hypothetical protein